MLRASTHYTAANGVEIRRQVVPDNAAGVAAALLDAGVDRSAKLHAYGGDFDVLEMLETSAHPHNAGVAPEVGQALAITDPACETDSLGRSVFVAVRWARVRRRP